MKLSNLSRKQAFLTHLTVSVGIFIVLGYLVIVQWFPGFYFSLDGGSRAIATLFFVDVVLGPGLTLLVFKPGKKSLKFDMAVIVLLQLSALSWGVNTVYTERSGTAVFYWGKFSCIPHKETRDMDMAAISSGPSGRQRLSFLQRPDTFEGFHSLVTEAYQHGSSEIYYYGDRIVPLAEPVVQRLQNYRLDLSKLRAENEAAANRIETYLGTHQADAEHIRLIPLSCRFGSAIAVYDTRQLRITDWLGAATELRAEAQDEPLTPGQFLQAEPGTKPLALN